MRLISGGKHGHLNPYYSQGRLRISDARKPGARAVRPIVANAAVANGVVVIAPGAIAQFTFGGATNLGRSAYLYDVDVQCLDIALASLLSIANESTSNANPNLYPQDTTGLSPDAPIAPYYRDPRFPISSDDDSLAELIDVSNGYILSLRNNAAVPMSIVITGRIG